MESQLPQENESVTLHVNPCAYYSVGKAKKFLVITFMTLTLMVIFMLVLVTLIIGTIGLQRTKKLLISVIRAISKLFLVDERDQYTE